MVEPNDVKTHLARYLQGGREALLWKLDGVPERDLRIPRTPTGTNLLGIVKHMVNVEIGYFGDTFGRTWPTPGERVSDAEINADPQADWYATESETAAGIIDLYKRVWEFSDASIEALPLDAVGTVPWWPPERSRVTLGQVLVHVLTDLSRHTGHADILRESIDGAAGFRPESSNLPAEDWTHYVEKLRDLADRY